MDSAKAQGNKFDSEVERKAQEAKGIFSSWSSDASKKAEQARADAEKKASEVKSSLSQWGSDAEKRAEQARQETGVKLQGAVDKFDKTVEDAAAKTKSGISSWFGGK